MSKQSNSLGYSVYPSTWSENRKQLSSLFMEGSAVFTSLHIMEEMHVGYVEQVEDMMEFLKSTGYKVIADVSKRTLEIFSEQSLTDLAKRLNIDILRIDYGFTEAEMLKAAEEIPICLNASTISEEQAEFLRSTGYEFHAMHNFYPRPETGIDEEQFMKRNRMLEDYGISVMAFIQGREKLRGPIHEGLPTLEKHRNLIPYHAFLEMKNRYGIQEIFVGDGILTETEARYIRHVLKEGVYCIPVELEEKKTLLNQVFTVRIDSPKEIIRIQESREYATPGNVIRAQNTIERKRGTITLDNELYKRYSGEIQITRYDFKPDDRVNVIGKVKDEYLDVLDLIPNGEKMMLVDEDEDHE
ncbi:MupG family TIM beta-alpha barrel fold protein [Proteiniclasticum sp. C24MP]|uniref:MupG family TIM beta-alpha barrel fold protein n=1 Tax=Proteiniclasticum sp. C24MP TaxID=3374101 RepID=UPI0037548C75